MALGPPGRAGGCWAEAWRDPRRAAICCRCRDWRAPKRRKLLPRSHPDHVVVLVADKGGFRPVVTLSAAFDPFSVVLADLNGDGRQDVAAGSGKARVRATWHGVADGSFRAADRYRIASGPSKHLSEGRIRAVACPAVEPFEAARGRTDLFERRRLMDEWTEYLAGLRAGGGAPDPS